MLLQTTSYIVPKEKRAEHARLLRRFRQILGRLGCDHFEVFEQVGTNWNTAQSNGRYVQIMRFRDRKHYLAVHDAELNDPQARKLISDFCTLINLPYQQEQGLFASGFYTSFMKLAPANEAHTTESQAPAPQSADTASPLEGEDPPMADAWSMISDKPADESEKPAQPENSASKVG